MANRDGDSGKHGSRTPTILTMVLMLAVCRLLIPTRLELTAGRVRILMSNISGAIRRAMCVPCLAFIGCRVLGMMGGMRRCGRHTPRFLGTAVVKVGPQRDRPQIQGVDNVDRYPARNRVGQRE